MIRAIRFDRGARQNEAHQLKPLRIFIHEGEVGDRLSKKFRRALNISTLQLEPRLLKDAGYRPIDARDGKEGLERTKDEPALIILDLEMPRMDGFEFLDNYIKNVPEEKRAPVLVFSGKDLTDVQEDLLKERVVGLVKKDDVSMDKLSQMIQGIIKS